MSKHLTQQRLSDLSTALATLMPDVVLQAALDTRSGITVALVVGLMTESCTAAATFLQFGVHRHEVL